MTSQSFKIAAQIAAMGGAPKDYADQAAADAADGINLGYVERGDLVTINSGAGVQFNADFPVTAGEEILAVVVDGVAGDAIEVISSLQVSASKADNITCGIFVEGYPNAVCTRTAYHNANGWLKSMSAKRSLELPIDGPVKVSVRVVSSSNGAAIYINGSGVTQANKGAAFSNLTVKKGAVS